MKLSPRIIELDMANFEDKPFVSRDRTANYVIFSQSTNLNFHVVVVLVSKTILPNVWSQFQI